MMFLVGVPAILVHDPFPQPLLSSEDNFRKKSMFDGVAPSKHLGLEILKHDKTI